MTSAASHIDLRHCLLCAVAPLLSSACFSENAWMRFTHVLNLANDAPNAGTLPHTAEACSQASLTDLNIPYLVILFRIHAMTFLFALRDGRTPRVVHSDHPACN